MDNAITVDGLKKSYGNNSVLKGITFNVIKGEIYALLGVNSTGKTTALRCKVIKSFIEPSLGFYFDEMEKKNG